jgi:hypothetical protein
MNGLTAKRLRQLAYQICIASGESPGEGANSYNQESNCVSWEPAYKDGYRHDFSDSEAAPLVNACHERATDPDGTPLLGMYYKPGTIHHAHRPTLIYKHLKKLWRKTRGQHEIFGKRFRKTLRTYAPPGLPA